MDLLKSMFSSPRKTDAAPASHHDSSAADSSIASSSAASPSSQGRPNRVTKKSPANIRKDKQRAERLASHVRNSSPLQEIINDRSDMSRRLSAPTKPAATPRAKPARRARRTLAGPAEETTPTQDSPVAFASQPAEITELSPEIDSASQRSPVAEDDEIVHDSQENGPTIVAEEADTELAAPVAAMSASTSQDVVQDVQAEPEADKEEDNEEDEEDEEVDDDEDVDIETQFNFTKLLAHRWAGNAIELKVDWHGSAPTWEPETNLHEDAPDALFAYWRAQGGRPENPKDPGLYDIFAIREHAKNRARLLVEWTGYPPEENTWVSRKVLEETAPELVAEYWKSVKPVSKPAGRKPAAKRASKPSAPKRVSRRNK